MFKTSKKKRTTCGSLNYIIGDHSKSKQSRIHSINSASTKTTQSHFMINEDAFRAAAQKLHNYFKSKSPTSLEKKEHPRIQSSLVVHKRRIETINTNTNTNKRIVQNTKYIFTSPKRHINY